MADPVNEFAYSFSQGRTFDACARRWWLLKNTAWGGWKPGAPERSRMAYRLGKMSNLWMLAGKKVHEVAKAAIVESIPVLTALSRYDSAMRVAWQQAEQQAKLDSYHSPKTVTQLRELHYTGTGIDDVRSFAKMVFGRGREAVERIYTSQPYLDVQEKGYQVVEAEELQRVELGPKHQPFPVWVVVDLAYRSDEGYLYLWDHKTGNPRESDHEQVMTYAVYAMARYDVGTNDLRLGLNYLKTGKSVILPVTDQEVLDCRKKIERGAERIRSKLSKPTLNYAPAERFPRTTDPRTCQDCMIFQVCKGHRDLSDPMRIEPGYE